MMPFRRPALSILVLCLLCAATSSCIARRRLIPRAANSTKPLLVADLPSLLAAIRKQYDAVQNFSATVDMVAGLGSTEKNHVTEYPDVRAYIRFRKPSDIRLIGLIPVVHSTMFDMVSDGVNFKLYIPSKGRFIVGNNAVEGVSPNKLENLRPQHFVDALVVQPIDLKADKIV